MNAREIIKARGKPGERYATNENETIIALWFHGRWRVLHVFTTLGHWVNGGDGLLVNGKPLYPQECFIEVPHENQEVPA